VEDDVDDAQGATERLGNREVEVEDDGGGEGPSEVRFPALPWEFSLNGRIPAVIMVWVG
jgi:hypothetical protein